MIKELPIPCDLAVCSLEEAGTILYKSVEPSINTKSYFTFYVYSRSFPGSDLLQKASVLIANKIQMPFCHVNIHWIPWACDEDEWMVKLANNIVYSGGACT